MKISSLVVLSLLLAWRAQASPCCATGSTAPGVITNSDLAQVQLNTSYKWTIGETPAGEIPVFWDDKTSEEIAVLGFSGAFAWADYWQSSVSLPVVYRKTELPLLNSSDTGIGDLKISTTFEALPEFSYSLWRPKVFVFAQVLLPTGESVYESNDYSSAVGKGVYTFSLGGLALKRWESFDANALVEFRGSLPRDFSNADTTTDVGAGFGTSIKLGGGYRFSRFHFGLGLGPSYEAPRYISTNGKRVLRAYQLIWNVSVTATAVLTDSWSAGLGYTDQTLLGPTNNVRLGRLLTANLRYGWPR